MADNSSATFYKTTPLKVDTIEEKIGNVIFVDGEDANGVAQRYVAVDDDEGRKLYRSVVFLKNEAARRNFANPFKMFYFTLEENVLWRYTGSKWVQLTSEPKKQIEFCEVSDLPDVGDSEVLYICGDDIYRYYLGQWRHLNESQAQNAWEEVIA